MPCGSDRMYLYNVGILECCSVKVCTRKAKVVLCSYPCIVPHCSENREQENSHRGNSVALVDCVLSLVEIL